MQPTRHTKAFKKKSSQLDREIAEAIGHRPSRKHTRRHHAVVQQVPAADAWEVVMDALLEHDSEGAAKIIANIREESGSARIPSEFYNKLLAAPYEVRDRFRKLFVKDLLGSSKWEKSDRPANSEHLDVEIASARVMPVEGDTSPIRSSSYEWSIWVGIPGERGLQSRGFANTRAAAKRIAWQKFSTMRW